MSTNHSKVITGLQTLARHAGHQFYVAVGQEKNGTWVIQFQAGENVAVKTTLETFIAAPRIVLEPFTDELVKDLK